MRKVLVYIAMSIDGYIARSDHRLDWLDEMHEAGEDYGYAEFIKGVDTVIMGRQTYETVKELTGEAPHKDLKTYVITSQKREMEDNVIFYRENFIDLVQTLKSYEGKDIYCDGGANIIHQLLHNKLIDEMIVNIIPISLGGGIRLFSGGTPELHLELLETKNYDSGLVQIHYRMN
jgi:dihydrofolate reductase